MSELIRKKKREIIFCILLTIDVYVYGMVLLSQGDHVKVAEFIDSSRVLCDPNLVRGPLTMAKIVRKPFIIIILWLNSPSTCAELCHV